MSFADSMTADRVSARLSRIDMENLTTSESRKDKLKAAFLFYCKREHVRQQK